MPDLPRILFHPPRVGTHLSAIVMRPAAPLARPASGGPPDLSSRTLETTITPNNGNMIHAEAMSRILASDSIRSGFSTLGAADEAEADKKAGDIDRTFDYVVMSFANIIRNYDAREEAAIKPVDRALDVLERTQKVRVVAFGLGIEHAGTLDPDRLHPIIRRLLDFLGSRGDIVGVRGELTEETFRSLGVGNARALGCPSFYLYPDNAMSAYDDRDRLIRDFGKLRVFSAGRLMSGQRMKSVWRAAGGNRFDYVFQSDIYPVIKRFEPSGPVVNDATGQVDPGLMKQVIDLPPVPPLDPNGFYYFATTDSWRQFAHWHDLYIGDRLHGGVIGLQAGVPALFGVGDSRVGELMAYFKLPHFVVPTDDGKNEAIDTDVVSTLEGMDIEAFRENYQDRVDRMRAVLSRVGLEMR